MKKVMIFLALFVMIGCGTKPQIHEFEKKRIINANFDATWTAVIEIFAEENIPITNIEKASGLIVSDRIHVDSPNCDCGKDILGGGDNIAGCSGIFNVFVKGISESKTSIMITTKYISNINSKLCTSTGLLETHLFRLIVNKAESS